MNPTRKEIVAALRKKEYDAMNQIEQVCYNNMCPGCNNKFYNDAYGVTMCDCGIKMLNRHHQGKKFIKKELGLLMIGTVSYPKYEITWHENEKHIGGNYKCAILNNSDQKYIKFNTYLPFDITEEKIAKLLMLS
jgi:hypothetical protein